MTERPDGADLEPIVSGDNGSDDVDEDQAIDTLEDGIAALSDAEDDTAEPEQPEAEEPDEDTEGETPEEGDAVIELPDGETMTVAEFEEVRANGLRLADYTRKTTELATQRKAVEQAQTVYSQRSQFVETVLHNLTGYLEGLVPPEPPLQLAQSDPAAFQYQRALRDGAMKEIAKVLDVRNSVVDAKGKASAEDVERWQAEQRGKLAQAMPHLADPAKYEAFRSTVVKAAMEDFGFTQAEADTTHDARVMQLVHYARLGKLAEKNRQNAKRRVETPKQARTQVKAPDPNQKASELKRRFQRTGSFEDALKLL